MDFLGVCLLLAVEHPEDHTRLQLACTSLCSTHPARTENKRILPCSMRPLQNWFSVVRLQFLSMFCFPKLPDPLLLTEENFCRFIQEKDGDIIIHLL